MALRELLKDYLSKERPAWLQSVPYGRARALHFLSPPLQQVFYEGGLTDGISPDIIAFWDQLAALARSDLQLKLLDVGRMGERSTLLYEEKRTGQKPKWVSVEDNSDGYDVLSIVEINRPARLSIEVKTTTISGSSEFHVTKNEWNRATNAENHVFHLWKINRPSISQLAIITTEQIIDHMPLNRGIGVWESVSIPYSIFANDFIDINC